MAAPIRAIRLFDQFHKNSKKCTMLQHYAQSSSSIPMKSFEFTENVKNEIDEKRKIPHSTFRDHPGKCRVKRISIPKKLEQAVNEIVTKYEARKLVEEAQTLSRGLWNRHPPIENDQFRQMGEEIELKLLEKEPNISEHIESDEKQQVEENRRKIILNELRSKIYHWKPIKYDAYHSLLYLLGRVSSDYAVLFQILAEIKRRDRPFLPAHVLDLGSGVGTVMWVCHSLWGSDVKELFNSDLSGDMNTLSRLLLQGGDQTAPMCFEGVYYRQFFPVSVEYKYELVTCAYTLMEMPNQETRLATIDKLWRKVAPGGYLVVVENGNKPGNALIMEARNHLLALNPLVEHAKEGVAVDEAELEGHVFAPCPHDTSCPREADNKSCLFEVSFEPLKMESVATPPERQRVLYSYIVLKKGKRDQHSAWPRIVVPPKLEARHVHCWMCTAAGKIEHSVFSGNKDKRELYRCVRQSLWGDLLPIQRRDPNSNKENDI